MGWNLSFAFPHPPFWIDIPLLLDRARLWVMGTIVQMICKCLAVTSLTYISSFSCSSTHPAVPVDQHGLLSLTCSTKWSPWGLCSHLQRWNKVSDARLTQVTAQRHASLPSSFVILEMTRHGFCTTNWPWSISCFMHSSPASAAWSEGCQVHQLVCSALNSDLMRWVLGRDFD